MSNAVLGSMGTTSPPLHRAHFARAQAWFQMLGWALFPWITGYAVWVAYQNLYVRWTDGFQPGLVNDVMTPRWWLFSLIVVGLGHLWAVASIFLALLPRLFGTRLGRRELLQVVLVWSAIVILHIPGVWWGVAGIGLLGPGRNAGLELGAAAADGNVVAVRALLWRGVPPDDAPTNNVTALSDAAAAGHLEIVRLLIAKGANVNHRGGRPSSTPLIRATEMNRLETVRYLVAAGANVDLVDERGKTALDVARAGGYQELALFLESRQRH